MATYIKSYILYAISDNDFNNSGHWKHFDGRPNKVQKRYDT